MKTFARPRATRAQKEAFFKLYERSQHANEMSYLEFRRTCIVVGENMAACPNYCGMMFIGIELDGYTHS